MKQLNRFRSSITAHSTEHSRALLILLALAWVLVQTLGLVHRAQHTLPQVSSSPAQVSVFMPDHAAGSQDCVLLDALSAADTASDAHFTAHPTKQPLAFFLSSTPTSATLTPHWHAPARAPPTLS